jgi:hypothetical protein
MVYYGRLPPDDPDVIISRGEGVDKCDGAYMFWALATQRYSEATKTYSKSIIDELKDRGYDITTIEFRIDKLTDKGV